jgi:type I restriction-modification system DNA methylase subunit
MTQENHNQKFAEILNQIDRYKGNGKGFNLFLDYAIYVFSMKKIVSDDVKTMSDKEQSLIHEALDVFSFMAENNGDYFHDSLGDYFMENLSHGKNGQFFTPTNITDMMALMTGGTDLKDGQTVCDPACGSGRTLLSIAKINRKLKFYGSDVDLTCVKMCAVNMFVNSMEGEVAWMNTLTMEHWKSYHIKNVFIGFGYFPFLSESSAGETSFKLKSKTLEKEETVVVEEKNNDVLIPQNKVIVPEQLTLFN